MGSDGGAGTGGRFWGSGAERRLGGNLGLGEFKGGSKMGRFWGGGLREAGMGLGAGGGSNMGGLIQGGGAGGADAAPP